MLRIDDKLSAAETKDFVNRANVSMDEAMASGADPTTWLQHMFRADMTYAVWQDPRAKFKVGVAVLHGKAVLVQARDTGRTMDTLSTYVRCTSAAEAQAMCDVHGDDKRAAA